MKIVELVLDLTDDQAGIEAISVVESPAIEENFVALNKHEVLLKEVDSEKRILMGAALVPNKQIYRRNDKTDEEIAVILTKNGHRSFDADHIKDLRITYNRRKHSELQSDDALEEGDAKESTIMTLLNDVIEGKTEEVILEQRLMGNTTAEDVASQLGIHVGQLYKLENDLKVRIRQAIRA